MNGCTKIPRAAARAQEDENHSRDRHLRPWRTSVRLPGSARTDQSWEMTKFGLCARQAAVITAPSITTPRVTYFQSAISSFRANATIVVFRRRPPRLDAFLEPKGERRASADDATITKPAE